MNELRTKFKGFQNLKQIIMLNRVKCFLNIKQNYRARNIIWIAIIDKVDDSSDVITYIPPFS